MSNFDSTKNNTHKKNKNSSSRAEKPHNTEKSSAKVRWSYIQSDLDNAAAEWTVDNNAAPVKTPDEEQLEKVKNIIEDLKEKLNEF